jgi:hypothetical protein
MRAIDGLIAWETAPDLTAGWQERPNGPDADEIAVTAQLG